MANRPTSAMSYGDFQMESNRPSSRRSNGSILSDTRRPESRMSEQERPGTYTARPLSSARHQSAATRPGTSILSAFGARLDTARPPTATSSLPAVPYLVDRPMTQQGVSGLRTATRTSFGERRMVHDKTYYVGLLNSKMGEISAETRKLTAEIESLEKDHSAYLTYEKRVKGLAAEVLGMQGEFSDYNVLSDLFVCGKDRSHVEEELKQIKRENKLRSKKIETIFMRRRRAEEEAIEIEEMIGTERTKSDCLVETLSEPMRDKYDSLREENLQLQEEMLNLQSQLDELSLRRDEMYSKICHSEVNRRAAQQEEEYFDVLAKREELLRETSERDTAEEELCRILQQEQMDNAEITILEGQIAEIHEEFLFADNQLKALEQEIDECDSDRHQKFRELKKREDEMDDLLLTFEDVKANEIDAMTKLETEITTAMEEINGNSQMACDTPENGIEGSTQEDLELVVWETEKAKFTRDIIEDRNETLENELEQIEGLEEKLQLELTALDTRMKEMKDEIIQFQDIDRVKTNALQKTSQLKKEQELWVGKLKTVTELLNTAQEESDKVNAELQRSEACQQLKNLETKWMTLEESNSQLLSRLSIRRNEINYEEVKNNALVMLEEYNGLLQERQHLN